MRALSQAYDLIRISTHPSRLLLVYNHPDAMSVNSIDFPDNPQSSLDHAMTMLL